MRGGKVIPLERRLRRLSERKGASQPSGALQSLQFKLSSLGRFGGMSNGPTNKFG